MLTVREKAVLNFSLTLKQLLTTASEIAQGIKIQSRGVTPLLKALEEKGHIRLAEKKMEEYSTH